MTTSVIDAPDRQRYEVVRNGTMLGYAAYQKINQLIVFTHTEVDPSVKGQGIGGQLVRGALDHVRTLGCRLYPSARSCRAGWPGTPTTSTSATGAQRARSPTDMGLRS